MLLYIFSPCLLQAAENSKNSSVYIVKGSNESDSNIQQSSYSTLSKAEHIAGELNSLQKNRLRNSTEEKPDPSQSEASNKVAGIGAKVNPQTGQLNVNFDLITLAGINSDIGVNLGISGGMKAPQYSENSILGLPSNINYNIDYIKNDMAGQSSSTLRLHLGSGQCYVIDSEYSIDKNYYPGLRYFPNETIKFTQSPGTIPYKDGDEQPSYKYLLTKIDGSHEYFGENGKLLCRDDRFGNHIFYHYTIVDQYQTPDVTNSLLTEIVDSYGNSIKIDNGTHVPISSLTITMPDGRQAFLKIDTDSQENEFMTLTNPNGNNFKLEYLSNQIRLTNNYGGQTCYYITGQIPYNYGDLQHTAYFPAVSSIVQTPNPDNDDNKITINYDYGVNGNYFTGAGAYVFSPSHDSVQESNNNGFNYMTKITDKSETEGDVSTTQIFNFLHLPVNSTTSYNNTKVESSDTQYQGQNKDGDFPPYYALPSAFNSPSCVTTELNNDQNTELKQENSCNKYGEKESVTGYNTDGKGGWVAVSNEKYDYGDSSNSDDNPYHLLLHTESTDYKDGNKKTVCDNTLSSDKRYIAQSVISENSSSNSSFQKTVTTEYDSYGRKTKTTLTSTDGSSITTTATYSSVDDNKVTIKTTDGDNNISSEVINIGNGLIQSKTDANNNIVSYEYPEYKTAGSSTDTFGLIVKESDDKCYKTTDNAATDPKTIVESDFRGYTKISKLDGMGRKINVSETFPGTNLSRTLETYTYNDIGKVASKTDVFGRATTYHYNDYMHRETSETDYLKNTHNITYDDANRTSTTNILDGAGNKIPISKTIYNDSGKAIETDYLASGIPGQNLYSVSKSNYNANGLKLMESLSNSSESGKNEDFIVKNDKYCYNVDGTLTDKNIETGDGYSAHVDYSLNILDKVTHETSTFTSVCGNGMVMNNKVHESQTATYDKTGHIISVENQKKYKMSHSYDGNGNLTDMTDFAGTHFKYTYDEFNKMISMQWTDPNGETKEIQNNYFSSDSGIKSEEMQSKQILVNGSVTDEIDYDYDELGRLNTVTMNEKTMNIQYDNTDRVTQITDFSGVKESFSYNSQNPETIDSIQDSFGHSISFTYYTSTDSPFFGDDSVIKTAKFSNGISLSHIYYTDDSNSKSPKLEAVEARQDSDNELVTGLYYSYDPANPDHIIKIVEKSDLYPQDVNYNNIKEYSYNDEDYMYKETDEDGTGKTLKTTDYTYDENGNIVKKIVTDYTSNDSQTTNYTYDKLDHLLNYTDNNGTTTLSYDSNGNITGIKGPSKNITMSYDKQNRMIEYKNITENIDVKYEYNAEGLRKSKRDTNSKYKITFYYYDGNIINESDSESRMSYTIGKAMRGIINADGKLEKTDWNIKTGKDVTAVTDESGKITNKYNYDAYGLDTTLQKNQAAFSIEDNPYKYSAQYYDPESGLYWLKARYYSPELMRFTSQDTYDFSNLYAYGSGNPIGNFDPSGHSAQSFTQDMVYTAWALVDALSMVFTGGIGAVIGAAMFGYMLYGTISDGIKTSNSPTNNGGWGDWGMNTSDKISMAVNFALMALIPLGMAAYQTRSAYKEAEGLTNELEHSVMNEDAMISPEDEPDLAGMRSYYASTILKTEPEKWLAADKVRWSTYSEVDQASFRNEFHSRYDSIIKDKDVWINHQDNLGEIKKIKDNLSNRKGYWGQLCNNYFLNMFNYGDSLRAIGIETNVGRKVDIFDIVS